MSITQAPARNPYHKPKTVDELTERNVELVAQLDETARAKRTPADCVVDGITAFCGSMSFIWVHALWFGIWIIRVVVQLFSLLTQEWLFLPLGAAVRPLVTIN